MAAGWMASTPTLDFSIGSLEFSNWSSLTIPGKTICYVIRYGQVTANLKMFAVESIIRCGPRSNIGFIQYIGSHFYYFCANYAVCVLPSYTSNSKIVYVRHYKSEIGVTFLDFVITAYALVGTLKYNIVLDVKDLKIALAPYVASNHFRYKPRVLKLFLAFLTHKNPFTKTKLHVNLFQYRKITSFLIWKISFSHVHPQQNNPQQCTWV